MAANQKVVAGRSQGGRYVDSSRTGANGKTRIQEILHRKDQSPEHESTSSNSDPHPAKGYLPPSEVESSKSLTVLIADDHPVVREGLVSLVDRLPDMRVVAQAGNGREAVEKYFTHRPHVALFDLRMPTMDGIEAVMAICERDRTARIGIITSFQSEEDIYRALLAGARGFILKDATPEELAECIHALAGGKTWVPPQVGAMLARRIAGQELTRRETSVLNLVAAGKSNKEIGVAFDISEATVKVHMTHILEKLKVTGRTEAINVAVKKGLIRLDCAA